MGKKGSKLSFLSLNVPSPSPPPLLFFVLVSFLARSKPKIPFHGLFLLRNQTETLATQASQESGNLGFGIQNTAQGIRNPTNDWNPESKLPLTKTGIQYMESAIHCVGSRIHKNVLDSLDMGRPKHTDIPLTTSGLKINGRNSLYVITCSCAPMILLVS